MGLPQTEPAARRRLRALTVYLRERASCGRRLAADGLLERAAAHGVERAVLLRGVEGYGHHGLESDRLLSLSEDLPLVFLAVDGEERVAALLKAPELASCGLATVEQIAETAAEQQGEQLKLTVWLPRYGATGSRPPAIAALRLLRDAGARTGMGFLGVDGVIEGSRRRARLIGRNRQVPGLVVGVGERKVILAAQDRLNRELSPFGSTLERVSGLAEPDQAVLLPEGRGDHWKISLYLPAGSGERHRPLYLSALERLRELGAPGATVLRGTFGFFNGQRLEGERLLRLRRETPYLVTAILPPELGPKAVKRLGELPGEERVLTVERVPAYLPLANGERR
jgi:PII-like signaling protein